ncbi:MAG: restriction endonuclease subunit S, partial [Methylococcales bacterium]
MMQTYSAYKDSGVDWLGNIPEHWEVKPGLTFFTENKRKNTGMKENTVLSLSYGKIIIKPKEKLTGLVPESFETYQIVAEGDVIIRCMDLQNDKTSLRTGIAKDKGIITSAYLNLNIFTNYNSDFIYFYLHALDITKAIYKLGSGLRQNLSFIDFKRLPVLSVPLNEQNAIVKHIENQLSLINKAIASKQKQIMFKIQY